MTAPVTASDLRTAILACLQTSPPLTAYKISAHLRQRYPYGASVPVVSKTLAAMEGAGEVRRVLEPRTRTDRRTAFRWETAAGTAAAEPAGLLDIAEGCP